MDPISTTIGLGQLVGGIFGLRSSRKQRHRLKAELERRRLGIIQAKNMAIGRVAEGTAAAKAPLEAIAERIRTEESFRDPVMEQAVAAGAREQMGAETRRLEGTQTSASQGIQQQQLLMAAVLSQAQMGSESRRLARRFESTRALTGIYSRLGELTDSGAKTASGIEMQFASMMQQEPVFNQEGNDPLAEGIGGLLSWLSTDTGKEALGGLFGAYNGTGSAGGGGRFGGLYNYAAARN